MSQVNVYTDLILRDAQFKEQLRAMEAEVLASAKRIGDAGFKIPVTIDDQASGQIETILTRIRAQDVRLNVGLNDEFTAQLEAIRTQAALPIRVPLMLEASGGGAAAAAAAAVTAAELPALAVAGGGGAISGGTTALATSGAGGGGNIPSSLDPVSIAAIEEAAAAEARAAATSNAATVAAGTRSFMGGGGAWRQLFHAMIVGRAAYDTGMGGYHLGQAISDSGGGMDDLLKQQQEIAAGQESIRKIPIAGEFIAGTGDLIERGANAVGNYFDTDKTHHNYAGNFESDRTYAERLTEETKIQDQHIKQLEKEVELRHQLEVSVDRTIRQQRGRAELATAAPLERPDISARLARENTEAEIAANPLFKDAKGRETEDAKRYREAENAAIDAQHQRDTERAIAENNRAGLAHRATVADLGEAQREAELQSGGKSDEAELASRHYAVDARLRAFENRADTALPNTEEKRRATEEFEAAKPAAAAEHAQIDADEKKRIADSVSRYEIEAERAKLANVRGSYDEELRLFEKMWAAKLATIQNGTERGAAIEARDAERAALAQRHQRDIADINASTHELELRTAGKDKEADVYRVTEDARRALDEAGNDLEKKGAILAHERAQLEALRHEDRGAVFGSVSSFARDVQVRDLRNEGGANIQAAIDAANAQQVAIDAARRAQPTPGQPTPPVATAPPPAAIPTPLPPTVAAPPVAMSAPPAPATYTPATPGPPITPPDERPTPHDDGMERQYGETIDAFRNRQMRAKYHHDGAFRQNPLTAKWDERARRGDVLRREREAAEREREPAITEAAQGAAEFTDSIMPGGGFFESMQPDDVNAGAGAAAFTDAIMPGGGWFESMQPDAGLPGTEETPRGVPRGMFAAGDQPGAFGNADLAKLLADAQLQPDLVQNALRAEDITNPTMDAIKSAMRPLIGQPGRVGDDMGGAFASGDDPAAKRDFKEGSSDFKEAADTFKRTVEDPRNQLYVVKY